jgi:trans-aconitate 2-methyltransferase
MSAERAENQWDAELYNAKHAFVWQHGASLIEWLAPERGERIVDLGCGTGQLTAQIADSGAEVFGIDASADMIEQARRAFPQLRFEIGDARSFCVDEPVDAVFSNAALHWVKEPEQVITRLRAAIKPGGRFVAEFGGRGNVQLIIAVLEAEAHASGLGDWRPPWYFPGIAEYSSLLEAQGFEVVRASLFERPTQLDGGDGLRRWVEMFANDLLRRLPPAECERLLTSLENRLRPTLFRSEAWFADYRRLRIEARHRPSLANAR